MISAVTVTFMCWVTPKVMPRWTLPCLSSLWFSFLMNKAWDRCPCCTLARTFPCILVQRGETGEQSSVTLRSWRWVCVPVSGLSSASEALNLLCVTLWESVDLPLFLHTCTRRPFPSGRPFFSRCLACSAQWSLFLHVQPSSSVNTSFLFLLSEWAAALWGWEGADCFSLSGELKRWLLWWCSLWCSHGAEQRLGEDNDCLA